MGRFDGNVDMKSLGKMDDAYPRRTSNGVCGPIRTPGTVVWRLWLRVNFLGRRIVGGGSS